MNPPSRSGQGYPSDFGRWADDNFANYGRNMIGPRVDEVDGQPYDMGYAVAPAQKTAAPAAAPAAASGGGGGGGPMGAIVGLGQVAFGIHQLHLANKIRRRGPQDLTPQAVRDVYAERAAAQVSNKAPGQAEAENRLASTLGRSVGALARGATSGAQLLSMANNQANNAYNQQANINTAASQFRQNMTQQKQLAQAQLGQYQDLSRRTWANEVGALRGGGWKNIFGGATTTAASADGAIKDVAKLIM